MHLWLRRTANVSLREQLVTQIELGILTRELSAGERLPSTRELARRFGVHANTASAAYRQLERGGWVEFRHGSGVYVRKARPDAPLTPELAVDRAIAEMAAKTRRLGASETLLRERLRQWLATAPPARWIVIEPDPELRSIVAHEMRQALHLPVEGCAPDDLAADGALDAAIPAVLPSKAATVRKLLPAGMELVVLEVQPASADLQANLLRYLPAHAGELVAIASHWAEFQRIAQIMLIAAGIPAESLLVRDSSRPGWKRGLEAADGVVCDCVTATELPRGVFALRHMLLSEPALARLRRHEQQVAGIDIA
jgi:DNA-binding transcriptional regulator YhcF (GntR family)